MKNPTARSKRRLESEGYTVASTERWNPYARVRQDMFGFIDLLAIRQGSAIAVQSTSGSNLAARVAKILAEPNALRWLQAAPGFSQIVCHGWAKRGPRGKRKTWECRERWITVNDFMGV